MTGSNKVTIYTDIAFCDFSGYAFCGYMLFVGLDLVKQELVKKHGLKGSQESEVWIVKYALEKNFPSIKANKMRRVVVFSDDQNLTKNYTDYNVQKIVRKVGLNMIKKHYSDNGLSVDIKYIKGHTDEINPNTIINDLCSKFLKDFRKKNNIVDTTGYKRFYNLAS